MRPISRIAVVAGVAAAALLAPRAVAHDEDDKAAEKKLRTGQAEVLAAFKSSLAADVRAFTADVVALEKSAAADGPAAAQALFVALVALQTDVTAHVKTAATGQATAAKDALAAHAPETEGAYPSALYPGDGTSTAAFENSVDSLLAKTYAGLRKRLAKTAQRIERAGTRVNFRVAPPRRPVRVWSSQIVDFLVLPAPTIDVVLAFSTAAAAGDGKLRVAGQATHFDGPVEFDSDVSATAVFNGHSADQKVVPVDGRYSADFGDSNFVEGVWLVLAAQNLVPADASIGVR